MRILFSFLRARLPGQMAQHDFRELANHDWLGWPGECTVEDVCAISAASYELALSLALRFDAGPAPRM